MKTTFTAAQAAAFRLGRHHLGPTTTNDQQPTTKDQRPTSIEALCRDTGGIQAQVMSQAEIALWTRARDLTRSDIQSALYERREIVKTAALRLTLHLISARDFPAYVTALKPAFTVYMQRQFARLGAKPAQVDAMMTTVMDALQDGPRTQQELIALARRRAGPKMRLWLKYAWSAVRPLVIEGLICYGPPRGGQVTFVRVDQWLPKRPAIDIAEARVTLVRRFLGAFGPASASDFSRWCAMRVTAARPLFDSMRDELVQVSVDGASGWMLRRDRAELADSTLDVRSPRLLPAFDSFILAHATKEHLIDRKHYKRVWRSQGWISPVVLLGGAIVGVWFPKTSGKTCTLEVDLFDRQPRSIRDGIEREAEALSAFVGTPTGVVFL